MISSCREHKGKLELFIEANRDELTTLMCSAFIEEWNRNRIEKLVIIPMFILDFLCIHPFNDGNG